MSLHCYRCSIKLKRGEIYYSDAPNIIYHWKCYIADMNELFKVKPCEWPTEEKPWVKTYSGGKPNYTQPIEQEPAAWGVDEGEGRCISLHDLYFVKEDADHMAELKGTHAKVVALYAAPPQREWLGLTDDEIYEAVENSNSVLVKDMARAIEAKLKEKNT